MKRSFETLCAQAIGGIGDNPSHILPIYQSASFDFKTPEQGIEIFKGQVNGEGYVYSRYGNPTIDAVAGKIAALESFDMEETATGLFCGSGMAAISVLCESLLEKGDVLLAHRDLYGGTTEYFNKLLSAKNQVLFADFRDPKQVEQTLRSNPDVRFLYFETPTNPLLDCIDISEIAGLATSFGCKTIVDNTFCTPFLQRPLNLGIDYIIHSTTKYLNGHGTGIGGMIVGKDLRIMRDKVWSYLKLVGASASPFEAWLLNNGLKTLCVRMDKQCTNAEKVAQALSQHPKIKKVNYPGISTHPGHTIALKQMSRFGAMLSFEIDGGKKEALKLMKNVEVCSLTPTLGDVDTLLLHPATSSHMNMAEDDKKRIGIGDQLIRVSVGIESAKDIIADLEHALEAV